MHAYKLLFSLQLEGSDAVEEDSSAEMKRTDFNLPENNIKGLGREARDVDAHHPSSAQLLSKRNDSEGANDREMSISANMAHSPSTMGFLPKTKRTKSFFKCASWTKTKILMICLVLFVLIAILMTALFVWSYLREERKEAVTQDPTVAFEVSPMRFLSIPLALL